MVSDLTVALVAGSFVLAGGIAGVLLSGWISRGADERRVASEDERRWLVERRQIYGVFLGLAESMLQEIDGLAVFLSSDGGQALSEDDEVLVREGLLEYHLRWDEDLQPALGEVQLMATSPVVDLADRVSGALMELTATVELRNAFDDHYPMWFQARDLLQVLRNSMRAELGLAEIDVTSPRSSDWPWLPDRPERASYVQQHKVEGTGDPLSAPTL